MLLGRTKKSPYEGGIDFIKKDSNAYSDCHPFLILDQTKLLLLQFLLDVFLHHNHLIS